MNYATVPAQTSLMIMECIRFHTIYNNKASGTLPMLKRRMILCTKDWFPGLFASLVDGSSKFYDLPPLRVREDYRNLGSIKTGIFVGGHPRNVLLTHLAPDKKNITTTTPNNPKIPTNDPYRFKKKKNEFQLWRRSKWQNFLKVQLPKLSSNGAPNEATTIIQRIGDDHVLVVHQPSSPNLPMWKMKKTCSYNRNGALGTFDTCFFHVEPDTKRFNHISKSGVWGFQQFNGEPICRVPPF